MYLKAENLKAVSFPVGGVGAGCIGLSGAGRLAEWEIFNRPGKGRMNGMTHFAVRAERNGRVIAARVLNGDMTEDLIGPRPNGFGFGPPTASMCGFPHFREVRFRGEFPVAEYAFEDPGFPARAGLVAWSPFVPGHSEIASMPCAVFEVVLENTSDDALDFTAVGVLDNTWENLGTTNEVVSVDGIRSLVLKNNLPEDDPGRCELALSLADGPGLSWQTYLRRGGWFDKAEIYWDDLARGGAFEDRLYDAPRTLVYDHDAGLLASRFRLEPGERKMVRYVLSWYMPNRTNDWDDPKALAAEMARSGVARNLWRNYYATLVPDAASAGRRILRAGASLRRLVFSFRDALHETTIPGAALDGAAENLSVLVSPVVLRLEDGALWGWEGVASAAGSCPGSCQHVWNYAQALALLFPDLERSLREQQVRYDLDERGGSHFRQWLPQGIRARSDWFRPCVDGTFGEVLKIYREWKISGDDDWLARMWPSVRKMLFFAWSPENPDQWDPEGDGVLTGRQHHTLDMELFGPSGWLQGIYLAALKAASKMASARGEGDNAAVYEELYAKGRRWTEEHLFNGEYLVQQIDLGDPAPLDAFEGARETYWDEERGEVKYQIGGGCEIDSVLGPTWAALYGLGEILDPAIVRATLQSICRYNRRNGFRDFANPWRVFALDDESGLSMCAWPRGVRRPVIPLPYHSENMTGFEWTVAIALVLHGMTDAARDVAESIRARYDGEKRNPWNEIECGSNYARSMAAYGLIQAYSGFQYDMTDGYIGFAPVLAGDFKSFWSVGTAWGAYERRDGTERIVLLDGRPVAARRVADGFLLDEAVELTAGSEVVSRQDPKSFLNFMGQVLYIGILWLSTS